MESNYGIAVTNKFDLFLDDEADPLEILRMQEEAKTKKKDGDKKKDTKGKDSKQTKNKGKSNAPSSQNIEKSRISDNKENTRDSQGTLSFVL